MENPKGEGKKRGRIGYWTTHEYHRRSVEDLQVESFCGWKVFLDMIEMAKDKDNPKE